MQMVLVKWPGMIKDAETKKARQIMADLDAVGNTTKAITKGVAIASAVIAAVSLFASFITMLAEFKQSRCSCRCRFLQRSNFRHQSIRRIAVRRCFTLVDSVPFPSGQFPGQLVKLWKKSVRQFRMPGIMEGTVKPDYARVVAISTRSAQKELIPLATISVVMPLLVGLVLQVEALGGFLAGVILSGQLLAVFMANAGGAWDNAKKSIEDEPRDLVANTGKGSERHKAGVVGDTVGDPLKDTAGPAFNPMIKVVNLVSLFAAPIIVAVDPKNPIVWIVAVAMLAAVIWAVAESSKSIPELGEQIKK